MADPSQTLERLRAGYPSTMTPAQIGALLNALAWEFRHEGMRLLGKKSGNNCPMPDGTLISTDYIVHGPTLTGHDVLTGKDDGTTGTIAFTWGRGPEDLADKIQSGERSLVHPVPPAGTVPAPPPPSVPPNTDSLTPRVAAIEYAQTLLASRMQQLFDLHKEVVAQIEIINKQVAHGSAIAPHVHDIRIFGVQLPTGPPK